MSVDIRNAEQLAGDAIRLARADSLMAVLAVLENGWNLHHPGTEWLGGLEMNQRERIRVLREQLVERDLYEAIYGPLPSGCCNPDDWREPDFAGAQDAFVRSFGERVAPDAEPTA